MALDFDIDVVIESLEKFKNNVEKSIDEITSSGATEMENYAKEHRPWTDRTGHAKQRLKGTVEKKNWEWDIILSHGVDYGIYLEQAHEQRFAIIAPTIKLKSPEIMKTFSGFIEKMSSELD